MAHGLERIQADRQDEQIHLATQLHKAPRLFTQVHKSVMNDYSAAIYGLIAFSAVITAGVVYVLAQPTDLPSAKKTSN